MTYDPNFDALFRQLLGLAPADPNDVRPPIDFSDELQLQRLDLAPAERHALKSSTFMARYGAPASFPDLKELRENLSIEDAQAMVKRFNETYTCAPLFKHAMDTKGPAFVFDSLSQLYPDPDATPEERHAARKQAMCESFRRVYGGEPTVHTIQDLEGPSGLVPGKGGEVHHGTFRTAEQLEPVEFVQLPEGQESLKSLAQLMEDANRHALAVGGADPDPNKNMVVVGDDRIDQMQRTLLHKLHDLDYTSLEQRVLASMQGDTQATPEGDTFLTAAEDAPYPGKLPEQAAKAVMRGNGVPEDQVTNFFIQAKAAGAQMQARLDTLKNQLEALAAEHGLTITGIDGQDGEQVNVTMPEGMPTEQQVAIAQELAQLVGVLQEHQKAKAEDAPGDPFVPPMVNIGLRAGMTEAPAPPEMFTLRARPYADELPPTPIMRPSVLAPGHAKTPMAYSDAAAQALQQRRVSGPVSGAEQASLRPHDPAKGEIGRVSPDLVRLLNATGLAVRAGDMLRWQTVTVGEEARLEVCAFDLTGLGRFQGPIALDLLPKKVQKRAAEAKRKLTP